MRSSDDEDDDEPTAAAEDEDGEEEEDDDDDEDSQQDRHYEKEANAHNEQKRDVKRRCLKTESTAEKCDIRTELALASYTEAACPSNLRLAEMSQPWQASKNREPELNKSTKNKDADATSH